MSIQGESLERAGTLQAAAEDTGVGTSFDCKGLAILALQVEGITSATITFQATVDGTNWVAVDVLNRADTTLVTTTTADGLFLANVVGLSLFRANITTYVSGTINVTGRGSTVGIGLGALS